MLSSPELSSKRCVYRQYDHQVLTNTVVGPGSDAAVMRIKGTNKAIALATDGDGRICYLDPFAGGAMAVAEAARNVVCAGATPVALTDCLNFGNPEKADVYYQLEQCIRGMIAACEKLDVPVISGNVSLYNETDSPSGTARAIFPTPVVGMLGLIDDVERVIPMSFQREGDAVYLLGGQNVGEAYQPRDDAAVGQAFQPGPSLHADPNDLAGSEYLKLVHGLIAGRPTIDLDAELHLEKLILEAAHHGAIRSAHDCSRGGLAVALAECCIGSDASLGLGASAVTLAGRLDATLFGEAPSRIIVSTDDPAALESLAAGHGVLCVRLGLVTGNRLLVGDAIDVSVEDLRQAWEAGLGNALRAPSLSS